MAPLQSSLSALCLLASAAAALPSSTGSTPAPTGSTFPGFDLASNWGNLSPYKDGPGFSVPSGVPLGCELAQVHVLHRHAQRYPTAYELDADSMEEFAQKLKNYSAAHPNVTVARGPLAFLNHWEYVMGTEALLPTGAATEATSGAWFWSKYGRTLYRAPAGMADWDESLNVFPNGTQRPKPMYRTTSQARILESARWWLSGFFSNIGANSSYPQYDLVIIPEGSGYNNTLSGSCTEATYPGDDSAEEFLSIYTKPTISRLSQYFPSDFNLTWYDILALQNLCPYEYAVLGSSSFCGLFTESEWKSYEYQLDLQFYGDYGFGSPSGRAQGIGYVLELAARLEGHLLTSPVANINVTYDSNPKTFPLHQPLFMDMSHDDVIVSVLAALGVEYFNYGPHGLPGNITASQVPTNRTFKLNEIAPFGARLVSEIWRAPADTTFTEFQETLYANPDLSGVNGTKEYIRWVLNDQPVPVEGVPGCEGSVNGFCSLEGFLGGVAKSQKLAEYDLACEVGVPGSGQVGDGRPE
ncbi:multiple inositol polyphosphate phosphatase [Aspergillus ellipticus CBS 707.79]|uniref:Multiple inositol polyphosphate phosphatase n=1 Tax=Aspergillus ellipticus CBS 707.79 TaxID=1448320 RepID=A0A319EJT2_9EURO|nr:multiple inositol polyphosphate phosphatase [Aspergillus ellipticus CBS 707.79]